MKGDVWGGSWLLILGGGSSFRCRGEEGEIGKGRVDAWSYIKCYR